MKKAIGIITAISLLTSSCGGVLAYSDMAESENSELTERLGIIEGYPDGSFRPEETLTRAEAVKILTAMLGYDGKAQSYDGISQFSDVSKSHWAYNYIYDGVSQGFIDGFGDSTFRPDDKVTIEQFIKMLVCMIGYETYAQVRGGYPEGYVYYGKNLDIYNIKDDYSELYTRAVTREAAMDMAAQALKAPVCMITDWSIAWDGTKTPTLEIKDGEGEDYCNLLTNYFFTYEVHGTVQSIKNNSMSFKITSARNFDDEYIEAKNAKTVTVKLDDADKNKLKKDGNYKAYIRVNDDEEYELVYAIED